MLAKLEHSSPAVKLIVWLLLMMVFTALAMVLWVVLTGGARDVDSLKLLQMLQPIGTFIMPALCACCLWSKQPMKWLHLDVPKHLRDGHSRCVWVWVLVPLMMLVASPGINLLSSWNQQMQLPSFMAPVQAWMQEMEDRATYTTELFVAADSIGILLYNIFLMALLPAVGEELCFRGCVQGLFAESLSRPAGSIADSSAMKRANHIAVWVTAIIFSAIHLQFFGFIPRMLLGALLGYLLVYSGSLWVAVEAHFTNNLIAVLSYYFAEKAAVSSDLIEDLGTGDTLWLGILSLLLAPTLLWYICWLCRTHGASIRDKRMLAHS